MGTGNTVFWRDAVDAIRQGVTTKNKVRAKKTQECIILTSTVEEIKRNNDFLPLG